MKSKLDLSPIHAAKADWPYPDDSFPPLSSLKKALPPTKSHPSPNSSLSPVLSTSPTTSTVEANEASEEEVENDDESEDESEDGEREEKIDEVVAAMERRMEDLVDATDRRLDDLVEATHELRRQIQELNVEAERRVRVNDENLVLIGQQAALTQRLNERIEAAEVEGRAHQEQVNLANHQMKKERAQFKQRTGLMQARIKFLEYELEKALGRK